MVVQSLGRLLQSSKVIALNVTTSVGQVAAAVRESKSAGADGNWLAPTRDPARHLVIPGMPQSTGFRDLYIAVPGTAAAQVKITAVTAKGSYQPTGGTGIDLLGGSAVSIALPSLGGVAGAISISSNVPVAATMLVPGGPAGTPGALAVSGGPIVEQSVLADNPARSAGKTELVLSAPMKAATVRITTATTAVGGRSASQDRADQRRIIGGRPGRPADRQQGHAVRHYRHAGQRRARLRRADHLLGRDRAVRPAGTELADVDTAPRRNRVADGHPALAAPVVLLVLCGVARIDRLRVDAKPVGELLDDHVEDKLG